MSRLQSFIKGTLYPTSPESTLNRQLKGYPRNHNYSLHNARLLPSRKLKGRWQRVAALYPETLTSLLDIGSCKGYFVLEAARRSSCRAAVGIDVYDPFIKLSRQVASHIYQPNANFHATSLDRFAANHLGNPSFQTVLLLNTYHYLFAGSDLSSLAYRNHRSILRLLHQLCCGRVIFSSPLELSDCPEQVKANCGALNISSFYTRDRFLTAADEFFRVEDQGLWGDRPLLVLHRRPAS